MKSKSTRHSSQIQSEINLIDSDIRLAYIRQKAATQRKESATSAILCDLVFNKGSEDLTNASNNIAGVIAVSKSDLGSELAGLIAVIEAIEGSLQYKAALEILAPLEAELAEAEDLELKQYHADLVASNAAEQTIADAKAAALAKAEAAIENQPDVVAARNTFRRLGQLQAV